ncbi:Sec-independent protein translocase protein TatB [SAR86 cluster bacterium]|nr:twin-arginine translocase subunit TatB [Gammaproteobacteria bacterium]MDC3152604.1 Sec-independent protein translocase protein TatB [SAR86 cluster bacterium]OUX41515.1 MAG: twin-arginine translocase subunit TatB [Gammaproteobacteria bacterium TMED278]RCL36237.1 MAG: twin-arginine translocase subunit TatB [SAR86 cluster bacterium]URQ69627.1 Sec-independent protein translocase protein TatB [SAR86 cluster bacterium]
MFQIGFLEILIILIFGLLIIGPRRLPVVIKTTIKIYKKIENKFNAFKKDIEEDIGADEIKKDVFNELRMEELEETKESNND